jgi:hypothetical protein
MTQGGKLRLLKRLRTKIKNIAKKCGSDKTWQQELAQKFCSILNNGLL